MLPSQIGFLLRIPLGIVPSQNSSFLENYRSAPCTFLSEQVPALPQCPSVCDEQSPLPQFLLAHWDTCSYGPLVVPQLPHRHSASQQPKMYWLLLGSQGKPNVVWLALGCAVGHWLVKGMGAVWEQGHSLLRVSYHVVSSESGYMRCLATVGPIWAPTSVTWVFFTFPLYGNLAHALSPWNGRQ